MLDKNTTVDDKSQSFATPKKHNNIIDTQVSQALLQSDTMKCEHNTKTHMTRQKVPSYVK